MQIAKRQAVVNPENTFFSVKRFIGRKMNEVGSEATQVPYAVIEDNAAVKIRCPNAGKDFAPEEISAQVRRGVGGEALGAACRVRGGVCGVGFVGGPHTHCDSQSQNRKEIFYAVTQGVGSFSPTRVNKSQTHSSQSFSSGDVAVFNSRSIKHYLYCPYKLQLALKTLAGLPAFSVNVLCIQLAAAGI